MGKEIAAQQAKGRTLHALHKGPQTLLLPNPWDAGSAVLLEEAGFPALATTSAGIAFAQGFRDGERIPRERMLEVVQRIAAAVSVPVTADMEAGYGARPEDVAETIRLTIEAGAVGANLEDGRIGEGEPLLTLEAASERVRAARAAADATGVPFVLNARTDPYLRRPKADPGENFGEAVRRGQAYREVGADCIFVPGHLDVETMRGLVREIGPINVLGAFSGRPGPSLAELQAIGVRRVSIGGSLSLSVMALVRRAAEEMRQQGTFGYVEGALTNAEMNTLFGSRKPPR